jgi:hypothetical protein
MDSHLLIQIAENAGAAYREAEETADSGRELHG